MGIGSEKKQWIKVANWKARASSTIEFSLLMPMILTLFTFLIYLSFFLYNRVETTANACVCALRGSRMEQETAEKTYSNIKKESKKLMNGNLLSIGNYQEQIKVEGKQVQVTYQISQQVPAAVIFSSLFRESTWTFQITKKAKKLDPVFFIRNCRKFKGLKKEAKEKKEETDAGDL